MKYLRRMVSNHGWRQYSNLSDANVPIILNKGNISSFIWSSDKDTENTVLEDVTLCDDFISEEEEMSLFEEVEPYLKKMRYEFDHWDDVSFD